jgi:hypothetical protein
MRRLGLLFVVSLVTSVLLNIPTVTPTSPATAAAGPPNELAESGGYWTVSADGGVFTYGGASFKGSPAGNGLNAPIVDATLTSSGNGYWLLGRDGGVFSYGDAQFFGSTGSMRLNAPVVAMAARPDSSGYWFVAADGGVFAFGGAPFLGSMGGKKLNAPIVGMAATPSGQGYWLVASDGGIFAFGDAAFLGSAGAVKLNQPIVAMATTEGGRGYWLVASDGGVFSYGAAHFFGSAGAVKLARPIVDMARTPSNGGYWLVASDGGVFSYGDAKFRGSAAGVSKSSTAAVMSMPRKRSAETSIFYYPWYSSAPHDGSWRHWDQGGNTPPDYIGADFWPMRGPYSSADATVVGQQMVEMKAAGIDTVIISWWGRGSWEDSTVAGLMNAAKTNNIRVAMHLEPYGGRADTITADYAYLYGLGIRDFYVYNADGLSVGTFKAANDSLAADARVFAQAAGAASMKNGTFIDRAAAANATGVYTYAGFGFSNADFAAVCDRAHARHLLCSPSVAPGFTGLRATPLKIVVDRKNGATYDSQWTGALLSGADVVSITSYNEWHEGSQIEPSVPHSLPDGYRLQDYVGAYGTSGNGANAYMDRTKYWTSLYKTLLPSAF